MMNYWISWYQPTEDYRPITVPSRDIVVGYWKSGERCSDNASTICAWVKAENEEHAKSIIREYWPEAEEWRFCEESEKDFELSDRFSLNRSGNGGGK